MSSALPPAGADRSGQTTGPSSSASSSSSSEVPGDRSSLTGKTGGRFRPHFKNPFKALKEKILNFMHTRGSEGVTTHSTRRHSITSRRNFQDTAAVSSAALPTLGVGKSGTAPTPGPVNTAPQTTLTSESLKPKSTDDTTGDKIPDFVQKLAIYYRASGDKEKAAKEIAGAIYAARKKGMEPDIAFYTELCKRLQPKEGLALAKALIDIEANSVKGKGESIMRNSDPASRMYAAYCNERLPELKENVETLIADKTVTLPQLLEELESKTEQIPEEIKAEIKALNAHLSNVVNQEKFPTLHSSSFGSVQFFLRFINAAIVNSTVKVGAEAAKMDRPKQAEKKRELEKEQQRQMAINILLQRFVNKGVVQDESKSSNNPQVEEMQAAITDAVLGQMRASLHNITTNITNP